MSTVDMSKIMIVGLEDEKNQILKHLMNCGFVQIDDNLLDCDEEEYEGFLVKDSRESEVIDLEQKISLTEDAIKNISSEAKLKKSLFPKKEPFYEPNENDTAFDSIKKADFLMKELISLQNEENSVINTKNQLLPWLKLDIAPGTSGTKTTRIILGTFSNKTDIGAVNNLLADKVPESFVSAVDSDKQLTYAYAVAYKGAFDEMMDIIKENGFSPVSFDEEKLTPAESVKECENKLLKIEEKRAGVKAELAGLAGELPKIKNYYDYLCNERDKAKAVENFVKTKTTFCFNGWMPKKEVEGLTKSLESKFTCYIMAKDPEEDEEHPVLLKNNAFVEPFEMITNMYSPPTAKDVDHNWILAIFFFLFYGIMMGDLGYGLILTVACGYVIYMSKFRKGEGSLYKIIFFCGISTMIFGLLLGSFFGVNIKMFQIINPLEDIMLLMGISLLMGIIHIFIGMGIKGYKHLRNKNVMAFIADTVVWYILITGTCLAILPIVVGDIGIWGTIGKYLFVVGALGVLLTNGYEEKNIFKKFTSGLSSLYGITSYFGDILSYTRIMALCLSSGIVAQVMNQLAGMMSKGPAIIFGIFILLLGHGINLFIGALGAYVHTSRLQYVEFFGKFYEGGGRLFKPFKNNNKYTSVQ